MVDMLIRDGQDIGKDVKELTEVNSFKLFKYPEFKWEIEII